MVSKESKAAWEHGQRVRAALAKRLDAATIRKLKADLDTAVDEAAKLEAEIAWEIFLNKVTCAAGNFGRFVFAPRHFAKRRQNAGDATASPVDYDCLCSVRDEDGVPICREKRANCKFKGLRKSHNERPNDGTGLNAAWFQRHREEQLRILSGLHPDDPEKIAATLDKIEKALRKANARRKRTFGEPFPLAVNAWSS